MFDNNVSLTWNIDHVIVWCDLKVEVYYDKYGFFIYTIWFIFVFCEGGISKLFLYDFVYKLVYDLWKFSACAISI